MSSMSRLKRKLWNYPHTTKPGLRRQRAVNKVRDRLDESERQHEKRQQAMRAGKVDSTGSPYETLPGDLDP